MKKYFRVGAAVLSYTVKTPNDGRLLLTLTTQEYTLAAQLNKDAGQLATAFPPQFREWVLYDVNRKLKRRLYHERIKS